MENTLTPEQSADEEYIAQMYAVIQQLEPARKKRLISELNDRLQRNL
jgi:hypothetical protein